MPYRAHHVLLLLTSLGAAACTTLTVAERTSAIYKFHAAACCSIFPKHQRDLPDYMLPPVACCRKPSHNL